MLSFALLLSALSCAHAAPLAPRDGATAYVNFYNDTGAPQHLASGVLYGIPNTPGQIPDYFYTEMGFNYNRGGGAQVGGGWISGRDAFEGRFQSALSNYRITTGFGGTMIFLLNDLWGADSTQNSSAPYPGDNGDWSFYDEFLQALISDINSNNITDNLVIDIWNEPEGSAFWNRPLEQWLQMYGRGYHILRDAFGNSVQLSGPSSAGEPHPDDQLWSMFAPFIGPNGSIPDQYTWHMESGGGSMSESYNGLQQLLSQNNLPQRLVNINEYATFDEDTPSGSAWWISQLERVNAHGLRGNWLSGEQLHDFLASLLTKPGAPNTYSPTGTGYEPVGDWQVYKYYATNMTGSRIGTVVSSDYALDLYTTVDTNERVARTLAGLRNNQGTWYIQMNSLSSLGLPPSGDLTINTYQFDNNGHWGQIGAPALINTYTHQYSDDSLTFFVTPNPTDTAYAFEFSF